MKKIILKQIKINNEDKEKDKEKEKDKDKNELENKELINNENINKSKFLNEIEVNNNLIKSKYQNKMWRKNQLWYKGGKKNECEKYQISNIENIIGKKIIKTYDRLNINDLIISKNINPYKKNNGFEWTENFDGVIINNNINIYFNLKFICDTGGAQIRTMKLVYFFIKYLNTLLTIFYLIPINKEP